MAALGPKTLTSGQVSPTEIYTKLVYQPQRTTHETFEAMNGALDSTNLDPAVSIPAWAVQYGASAMGRWFGFDQPEFVYARQLGGGGTSDTQGGGAAISERAVSAQLTSTIFMPWQASVVLFGVQAFFCQDATVWNAGAEGDPPPNPIFENWDYRIEFGGTVYKGLYGRLPSSRKTSASPTSGTDPGYAVETRWRFVSKFGMAKNVPKGHSMVRVSLWANVEDGDPALEKVVVPTGGVWVLAIR